MTLIFLHGRGPWASPSQLNAAPQSMSELVLLPQRVASQYSTITYWAQTRGKRWKGILTPTVDDSAVAGKIAL
jgi:hypothetical protein